MKRFLFFVTFTIMSISFASAYDFSSVNDDGVSIYYNITSTSDLTCEVTYGGDTNTSALYSGDVVIPNSVPYNSKTYTVTKIGLRAFESCTNLTSISIPNSVIYIGEYAFTSCKGLTSIIIPNSVNYINDYAFNNCSGLTYIDMPNSIKVIGSYAFNKCTSLTYLPLPSSVGEISEYAFQNCTGLVSITIPNNIYTIGKYAFSDCSSLSSVNFPDHYVDIEHWAFRNCTSITSVNLPEYFYLKSGVFSGCTNLKHVNIPDTYIEIYNNVFSDCINLTEIELPNSIQEIGSNAFVNCTGLTSFTIPSSVTSIGGAPFNGCTNLTSIVYNAKNATVVKQSSFTTFPTSVKTLIIGNEVESIPDYFIRGCSGITSLTLPNTITSIGEFAFAGCSSLGSINIPKSVTAINQYTFDGCKSLISIDIPNSVISIGQYAFAGCSSLTSIAIPDGITKIENGTFAGCTNLSAIDIPKSLESLGVGSFSDCISLNAFTIPSLATGIQQRTFAGCTGLQTISIPANINFIDDWAFMGCSNLKSVYCYADNVPNLASYAFKDDNLDNVILYVPNQSVLSYQNDANWSQFLHVQPLYSVKDIADGIEYSQIEDETCYRINYTRTFSNTSWQGLYIPFTLSCNDWSRDFDIARINDVHQYDYDEDGNIDETAVEIIMVKSGSTEPNTPYFIKAKDVGDKVISVMDATLCATAENSFDVSSWNTLFTFTGTYSIISGSTMFDNGYYALGNGTLHQAESADNDLSPFRWYMSVTDRNGSKKNINDVKVFMLNADGTQTYIQSMKTVNKAEDAIYTLSGNRVNNMTKGLYVKNGKKVFVK